MEIRLETDAVTLGVILLDGLVMPEEYALPGPPETGGDVGPARKLYRAIGIDPTRTRPSSEALVRRLRRGDELPRINALVDGVNYCSVALMLPFGAYDRAAIGDEVTLRVGREGEGYEGIGKPHVNVAGRYVLADAQGPFGNPTADSRRACIHAGTREALVTIFAPRGDGIERIDWVARTLSALAGGTARYWLA